MTDQLVEEPEGRGGVREDRRVLLITGGMAAGAFAMGAAVQAAYIYSALVPGWSAVDAWSRILVNALTVVALVLALLVWGQHRRTSPRALVGGMVFSAFAAAAIRVVAQVPLGVYQGFARTTTTAELTSGFVAGLVSSVFATWAMLSRRRVRAQAEANQRLAIERALAISALEEEEVRVRRDVAEGLHASVQQRLVLVVAQTAEVCRRLRSGIAGPADAAVLDEVCASLDQVREQDVRGMSRLLYPDQLEVGMVPAVRALLRRVPSSVATRLDVDPEVRALDDPVTPMLTATERLLAVRVVEEGIGNALRHGHPSSLVVSLGLDGRRLVVRVDDDGNGLPPDAVRSGTNRLGERLAAVGGTLELTGAPGGGARLTGRLPLAGSRGF